MFQYIYKISISKNNNFGADVIQCYIISSAYQWGRWLLPILRAIGCVETIKVLLGWVIARKTIYFYANFNVIQSYGIVTYGYCKFYQVEFDAAVIGPVNTLAGNEGRGLATAALHYASMWLLDSKKCSAVYIDTAESNHGMQRVIIKSGFTGPIKIIPRL